MASVRIFGKFALAQPEPQDIVWAQSQLTQFWLSHSIDAFDCAIAASAHRMQLPLYTVNLKHFMPLLGNRAVRPY